MMESLTLRPDHKGNFEVFSTKQGKRYARYSDSVGYTWYVYDFFTESYQSLYNETMIGSGELVRALEEAYQKAPIVPLLSNDIDIKAK